MKPWPAAFAADLHLQATDGDGLKRAVELVRLCREKAAALYLLGDVFDIWTSRSLLQLIEWQPLFTALREAAADGLKITFLPGNRDFNLTPDVGREIGLVVHPEVLDVTIADVPMVLTHGDCLLSNDRSYQRYKRVIRSLPLRLFARSLPGPVSLRMARRLRRISDQSVPRKSDERLAIVSDEVRKLLGTENRYLLCGHVHQARRQEYGEGRELLVLPPFLEQPEFLVFCDGDFHRVTLDGEVVRFQP